jgi:hypothetical protein
MRSAAAMAKAAAEEDSTASAAISFGSSIIYGMTGCVNIVGRSMYKCNRYSGGAMAEVAGRWWRRWRRSDLCATIDTLPPAKRPNIKPKPGSCRKQLPEGVEKG